MSRMKSSLHLTRRQILAASAGMVGSLMLPHTGRAADMASWSEPADKSKAMAEAENFTTYGMPDNWANYGEVLQKFARTYGFKINHVDTDMSSLQEITKFDEEKNNPVAISADIGILFGRVAEERGVVPACLPPNLARLPAGLRGKNGGWTATFTGVPAMVVNTDVVKNVPRSWQDLLKPEYTGKVGSIDAGGVGGTDLAVFIAWAYANGGSETNLEPVVDFARAMIPQFATAAKNTQTLERGEVPIQLKYDFNCIASASQLRAKGVNCEVVIPKGSIYAPSAMMINKYNVGKMNVAKLWLDYVLSDEAQTAFAKFGARPIRWVLGDLKLPAEATKGWLPDSHYQDIHVIQNWADIDIAAIAGVWQGRVVGG